MEQRIRGRISVTFPMQLIKSHTEVDDILSIIIGVEIKSIGRFSNAEQSASYAGTVLR